MATGRGFEYDCVIIPLLPTKENIANEKEKNQEIVWSAIVRLNLIFLGGGDGRHVRLSMMQCFIFILIYQFSLQKDISFDLVLLLV